MSDRHNLPLPVQPEWQSQYSYLAQHEPDAFPRPFADSRGGAGEPRHLPLAVQGTGERVNKGLESPSSLHGPGSVKKHGPGEDQAAFADRPTGPGRGTTSPVDHHGPRRAGPNHHFRTVLSGEGGAVTGQYDVDPRDNMTDEGDFEGDDDEMVGAEGDSSERPPQTAAERLAARRKMKRFRCGRVHDGADGGWRR